MHALKLHLVRLSGGQIILDNLNKARHRLIKEFTIIEEPLVKTEFIATDLWTMGDIPVSIRFYRWHLFNIKLLDMGNFTRYYDEIKKV